LGAAIMPQRMPERSPVALAGVRIERVLAATVEVAEAAPVDRRFPDRISGTLGVCLKTGAAHEVQADGRSVTYPENAVCVRTPGCVWATRSTGKVGFLALDIEAAALPDGGISGEMRFARAEDLPDLRSLAETLRGAAGALEKQSAVTALVSALLDARLVKSADLGVAPSVHAVRRARDLLLARVAAPPTLDELSDAVECNRFVLLRQFRRACGLPPHAFVLRTRVEQARARLARGADVAEVAHELGFADQSHFTRLFKRVVGLTPGSYRRMTRVSVARP
jgi:AraC-like DNA-binding protein